jgi:murein DD-endopeptidase MepM/ murein hydrolase activator NlpD
MGERARKAGRFIFAVYLVALHLVAGYFLIDLLIRRYVHIGGLDWSAVNPQPTPELPRPEPEETPFSTPDPLPTPADPLAAQLSLPANQLSIPVAGITADKLYDSFSDARSADRYHDAIDIPAPAGTPVLAALDGEIVRLFDSEAGGITIYQMTDDRRYVLYYAHLQSRAAEVTVGKRVSRGTTIGYVGDSGNAGTGNFHLHFSVAKVNDPKRFWEGTYLNPYPLLRGEPLP